MAVYNKSGNEINVVYGIDGTQLLNAYSYDGEQVFPDESAFKVMTYNVQFFNGINSQSALQTAIINKYTPDIIGMQELGTYSASNLPAVGSAMLADYPTKQFSNHKNKVLIASKDYTLSNIVIADFVNQDPEDMSQYSETRAYMKADITVNGKTVTFINTHLCYLTQSVKWQQMGELFSIAEQCEYAIITGDFNSGAMTAESDDYIHMYKPFVDAGYNLANNSPQAGFTNTFTTATTASSLSDLTTAPDTIITTGNIDINSVVFDTTKFSYLNGSSIDHIPVVAYLSIK